MPERSFSSKDYRYGFNGKEKDEDEEWGDLTHYDYGFRIYNPGVGRFLSVDPLTANYSELTPYQFASNTPIQAIDLDGLEAEFINGEGEVKSGPYDYEYAEEQGWQELSVNLGQSPEVVAPSLPLGYSEYVKDNIRFNFNNLDIENGQVQIPLNWFQEKLGGFVLSDIRRFRIGEDERVVDRDGYITGQDAEKVIVVSPPIGGKISPGSGGLKSASVFPTRFKRSGKIKKAPKFSNLKDHARRHSNLSGTEYFNQAVKHLDNATWRFKVRHSGQTKIAHVTKLKNGQYLFTSTNKSTTRIYTHLEVNLQYLRNKGITLPD